MQPQLSLSIVPCSLRRNKREGEVHVAEVDEHDVVTSGKCKTKVLRR